ncbi:MAG: aconitate hydratase, partial [Chitinivibrionales bacterium]
MGRNVVEKILGSHLVRGEPEPGSEAALRIDQTLTQDATGTMAYLQLEAIGVKRVKTELSVSYVDHNTVQEGFENADDHEYLKSVAAKYGIKFSKAGNGICHQVHLERFGIPGKTLLGSDSHTPTAGGIGMIGIGAGGLDVAAAMGGAAFNMTYPKVIKVELKSELQPWVTAKDIILKVLEKLSTKGNVGCIIEYGGEGVKHLSVPERATITNMGAETGVTTSVFPSDSVTREFLSLQDRANSWREIKADSDARYNQVIEIDLEKLVPLAACPHSPGNIKSVKELSGLKVNQVAIGSCTNSSYKDIMTVARLLSNRKAAERVSLGVSCGSRQVLNTVEQTGEMKNIVQAGARILESVCGFCIGNSFAPSSNSVSLRTSNRNFFGRSGTNTADIYLVSPVTAVAAALSGEIRDPQEYFKDTEYPEIDLPEKLVIDDSMIIEPSDDPDSVEIVRGPNISSPPETDKPGDSIKGQVTIKVGDKITTDHIMPAGSRLKYRSNIPKYSEFVFERHDPEFYKRAVENRDKGVSNIIVAGESYGQGSSREHAAICPAYLGVGAVIAKSIERIHKANLINFGILPVVFSNREDYEKINQGGGIEITDLLETLKSGRESLEIKTDTGTF